MKTWSVFSLTRVRNIRNVSPLFQSIEISGFSFVARGFFPLIGDNNGVLRMHCIEFPLTEISFVSLICLFIFEIVPNDIRMLWRAKRLHKALFDYQNKNTDWARYFFDFIVYQISFILNFWKMKKPHVFTNILYFLLRILWIFITKLWEIFIYFYSTIRIIRHIHRYKTANIYKKTPSATNNILITRVCSPYVHF